MGMISLMGLMNYDPDLFHDAVFPEDMDRDVVIDNLIMECAELEVIYASPQFMKYAIGRWCRKEFTVWTKLYNTEKLEYEPLWNVDGTVTETEVVDRTRSGSNSGTTGSSSTSSNTKNNTGTDSDSGTNTEAVTGYNSSTWQDHQKNTNSNTKTLNLTETDQGSISGTGTNSGEYDETEGTEVERTTRRTGNIGVTSSQQLLREEREVNQFNTMDYIINSFKKRFCLLVY